MSGKTVRESEEFAWNLDLTLHIDLTLYSTCLSQYSIMEKDAIRKTGKYDVLPLLYLNVTVQGSNVQRNKR